jgi:hypothetical protein
LRQDSYARAHIRVIVTRILRRHGLRHL